MSNVLKVEFKESFLTNNKNIEKLLSKYEVELKTNDFKSIKKSIDFKLHSLRLIDSKFNKFLI